MATYKVLQDIESEDKLFGPLTLKQFIFAAVTILLLYLEFQLLVLGIPIFLKLPLVAILLPFIAVFGFMAAPLGRDQPNDIWLLARLRFLFKPRKRLWNQDGMSELVTITAPKKETHVYTNNYSQTEVRSRLTALANTLDSRGWAVKNVNTNLFSQPGYLNDDTGSDRLLAPSQLPQDVPAIDITAADDILDANNNSTAQHLESLVQQSTANVRQQAASQLTQAISPVNQSQPSAQDYWFMNQPTTPQVPVPQNYAVFDNQQVVAPGTDDAIQAAQSTADEEAFAHELSQQKLQAASHVSDHMKVLQPLHDRDGNIVKQEPAAPATDVMPITPTAPTPPLNPALGLANNNDFSVATIASEAKRINQQDDNEVTISLH